MKRHSEVGSSVLKVVVQRVRPGTEAYDSEWALLKSWFDEHHAGEGCVHVHGLIVGTYSLAGPCLYRKYQEAGLNINCFHAQPARFQALFAAPPLAVPRPRLEGRGRTSFKAGHYRISEDL